MLKKILMLVLFLAPFTLSAQKFAHFDLQNIVEAMPDYKTAQTELEALGKQYQSSLEDMQKEYTTKRDKYSSQINEKTPQAIIEQYSKELGEMQQKIEETNEKYQTEFSQKRTEKMQPILTKILDAVNAIAKEGSYVYIIDQQSAQSANIFINTSISEDVTAKVKGKLGI